MKLVLNMTPTETNARNSEGTFIRLDEVTILFAYSRYNSSDSQDHAGCDIAGIYSRDEGESWSEPVILVKAKSYDVQNIMSVSSIRQNDGKIALYYIIKENDGSSSIGRALSDDGKTFAPERCVMNCHKNYYVFNNDRLIRLKDGRLAYPAAFHGFPNPENHATTVCFFSDDDGKTFYSNHIKLTLPSLKVRDMGMQEPGVYQHKDGTIRIWARTSAGAQYESYSRDGLETCTAPAPSIFTSPCSPMELALNEKTDVLYAAYNPVPGYHRYSKDYGNASMGRTPFVIRKSEDDGKTWSKFKIIEDDKERGYCYPAMFFTNDDSMLLAYCRGNADDGLCLSRLGMMKIDLSELD
ncbi:MAG: exo-alpha-sialidase [Clostridia bacterium]|nr:exo-alpha-sialidase [Clostridia bacterium]